MIQVKIRLFGAFRQFSDSHAIELSFSSPPVLSEVRQAFVDRLQEEHPSFSTWDLVFESAFADNTSILGENEVISQSQQLAILPPVCGG